MTMMAEKPIQYSVKNNFPIDQPGLKIPAGL